jgi:DNA phosphorothioation system restriction enzyme
MQTNEFFPKIPSVIHLREYQQVAIRNWFRNNCQGLLEMATGTGKTITALSALAKLWEVTNRLGVVIVCPYTHLVDQWVKDIKLFNMSPIVAYQSRRLWEESLYNEVSAFQSGLTNHFCVITTIATFTSDSMQNILKYIGEDVLFIADEAHHLGAKRNKECLIPTIPFRLALSATPNRWHDEEGTGELIDYFGNSIVYQYGLDKAIGKFLTEYYYYPHIVYLDEDESEYYYEVTKKIARMSFLKESIDENESLQSLLIERSRIIGRARNKIGVLKDLMKNSTDSKYNIVYCGDSKLDGEKQIDSVVKMLGNELDMNVHTFTSREDKEKRQELLKMFEDGDIQVLVAIKCLDEGVDVPATQTAYILASSTNPREFIQRRGRVLRKHKNKQFSYIHDFIVIPRQLEEMDSVDPALFNTERNLIKRELVRFTEFADLAINGPLAHETLNELKHAYQLLDI